MKTNLYIDCEWFPNQQMFLIGYAYSLSKYGQLYDNSLTKANFINLLKNLNPSVAERSRSSVAERSRSYIFFYGPDIGMLEKYFSMDIRHHYNCINLLPLFKQFSPHLESHRLCELEKVFGLKRSSAQYKKDIRTLISDWYNPVAKKNALKYNREDVLNLLRLKNLFFSSMNISPEILPDYCLK